MLRKLVIRSFFFLKEVLRKLYWFRGAGILRNHRWRPGNHFKKMESICAESGITGVVLGERGAGTGAGAGAYDCENEEGDCYPSPA